MKDRRVIGIRHRGRNRVGGVGGADAVVHFPEQDAVVAPFPADDVRRHHLTAVAQPLGGLFDLDGEQHVPVEFAGGHFEEQLGADPVGPEQPRLALGVAGHDPAVRLRIRFAGGRALPPRPPRPPRPAVPVSPGSAGVGVWATDARLRGRAPAWERLSARPDGRRPRSRQRRRRASAMDQRNRVMDPSGQG